MAHFIGKLEGARGPASRLGHKGSGLRVVAASWNGAVKTTLYHNDRDGKDYAIVALIPWHGKGVSRILYEGPVDAPDPSATSLSAASTRDPGVNHYDQQADERDAEKEHEAGGVGFIASVPDRGVIYVDRDPVSTDKQGDR